MSFDACTLVWELRFITTRTKRTGRVVLQSRIAALPPSSLFTSPFEKARHSSLRSACKCMGSVPLQYSTLYCSAYGVPQWIRMELIGLGAPRSTTSHCGWVLPGSPVNCESRYGLLFQNDCSLPSAIREYPSSFA